MGHEAHERAAGAGPGFGSLLRHYRQLAGLSQQTLAERAGLSVRGIADLERGARRFPYPGTIGRLAEALSLSDADRAALAASGLRSNKQAAVALSSQQIAAGAPRHNLPEHLPTLIGRADAVLHVGQLMLRSQTGLVTLTGPGGSGKTRLALAVAAEALDWPEFPDGVWLAELAAVADPMLLPGVVAAYLGVREQVAKRIRDSLVDDLRVRSLLLVLDNCEHLVAGCADLARDLLRNCPGLRILSTSREPLRMTGERVYRVPPLPTPDLRVANSVDELTNNPAVQLFMERAQAVEATMTITPANSTTIAEICTRLDGLPLAIELAAARTRILTPDQILNRLDDAIRLLVGGSRSGPTRQQTLRATLDWSYQLLNSAEQRGFQLLAVFAGGFDVDAVEAIWSEADGNSRIDALDVLTTLVDRSLVTSQALPGGMRYRLLEPVRQYAQSQLMEHGDWEAARKKHTEYFLRFAERGNNDLVGIDAAVRTRRLELEHDNLRAVLRRSLDAGDPETALRTASALQNFWRQFGHRNEGMNWLNEVLARSADVDPSLRARALHRAGDMAYHVGSFEVAKKHFQDAAQLRRELGDRPGLSMALGYYGRVVTRTAATTADYARGKAALTEAIALAGECGALWWAAWNMLMLGAAAWEQTEFDLAATVLTESEAILTQLGESHAHSHVIPLLGSVLCERGDCGHGRTLIENGLAESRAGNFCADSIGEPLYRLALLARSQGDLTAATQEAVESLIIMHQAGNPAPVVDSLELLGGLAGDQGLPDRAALLFSASAALRQQLGLPLPPIMRATYEQDVASARQVLGEARFAQRWAEGRAMSNDQVIEYARQVTG